MKKFVMAVALICALSTSIFAGDMPTTGAVGQQPPPTKSSTSSTVLANVILTIISLIR